MSEIDVRYPTIKSLPKTVKAYIIILVILLFFAGTFSINNLTINNINWLDILVFLVLNIFISANALIVSEKGQVRDLGTIFFFATIFLFQPEVVFFIILFSVLITDLVIKAKNWAKIVNLELSLIYLLTAIIFVNVKSSTPFYQSIYSNLLAILIAGILILSLNFILHLIIYLSLFKEDSIKQGSDFLIKDWLIYEVTQPPIGLLVALTYHFQKISIVLVLLPVLFLYVTRNYQSRVQQKEREAVEEKRRIEQDAHDRIYNRLGALAKKAELALDSPTQMEPTLSLIKDDLQKSVADLQNIIRGEVEVAEIAEENYLQKELAQICEAFKNKSDIKLSFNCDESLVANIAPQHFWHLQCIIEECLNNIHKHSKATEASVQFQKEDTSILVTIADNGTGMKTLSNDDCRISNEIQIENRKKEEWVGVAGNA